jgi:hypothetical protein
MKTEDKKTEDRRVSVFLGSEQLIRIGKLQEAMDIDLSKVVRWCIDACLDMGDTLPDLHEAIGPEFSGKLRQITSPRTNFLLDTIAEQVDKGEL